MKINQEQTKHTMEQTSDAIEWSSGGLSLLPNRIRNRALYLLLAPLEKNSFKVKHIENDEHLCFLVEGGTCLS